jgi:hypothetical protein
MKQYLLSALVIAALVIAAGCSGDAKVETEPADITFSGGGDAISFMWDDDNDDAQNHPRSGPGVDIQIVYDNRSVATTGKRLSTLTAVTLWWSNQNESSSIALLRDLSRRRRRVARRDGRRLRLRTGGRVMVKIRWDNDYYFIYAGALYRCGASKDSYRHYRFVNHPELRDNECFWSNVDASKVDATLRAHPTYRVGQTAYDIYGNELPSMQPVFAGAKCCRIAAAVSVCNSVETGE